MREYRRIRVMPGDRSVSVSMLEGWRPYVWRDPARCSPVRRAELAAHDEHIAQLNFMLRGDPNSKRNGDNRCD